MHALPQSVPLARPRGPGPQRRTLPPVQPHPGPCRLELGQCLLPPPRRPRRYEDGSQQRRAAPVPMRAVHQHGQARVALAQRPCHPLINLSHRGGCTQGGDGGGGGGVDRWGHAPRLPRTGRHGVCTRLPLPRPPSLSLPLPSIPPLHLTVCVPHRQAEVSWGGHQQWQLAGDVQHGRVHLHEMGGWVDGGVTSSTAGCTCMRWVGGWVGGWGGGTPGGGGVGCSWAAYARVWCVWMRELWARSNGRAPHGQGGRAQDQGACAETHRRHQLCLRGPGPNVPAGAKGIEGWLAAVRALERELGAQAQVVGPEEGEGEGADAAVAALHSCVGVVGVGGGRAGGRDMRAAGCARTQRTRTRRSRSSPPTHPSTHTHPPCPSSMWSAQPGALRQPPTLAAL